MSPRHTHAHTHTHTHTFWEVPVILSCWANQNILTHVHSKLMHIERCSWRRVKDVWRLLKWWVTLLLSVSVSTADNRSHIYQTGHWEERTYLIWKTGYKYWGTRCNEHDMICGLSMCERYRTLYVHNGFFFPITGLFIRQGLKLTRFLLLL